MAVTLTFLGTGTSQGVPVIACPCSVCQSPDAHDRRLRTSALISTQGRNFVIDTGPDFRYQMLRAQVQRLDGVLMTHPHKDHVAGLDDVRAFNFRQRKPMDIYADQLTLEQLKREFAYAFDGTNYPGIPQLELHTLNGAAFQVAGVSFTPLPVLHHRMWVNGFRVENVAYITDASAIPESTLEKLKGLDVLVLNALRREPHIAHFNLAQALQMIAQIAPRRAYLTHISHLLGLHAAVAGELPQGVAPAYDGLVVESA